MTDIILIAILFLMISSIGLYLYKAKKRGEKCIGCPYAKQCSSKSCNCGTTIEDTLKH